MILLCFWNLIQPTFQKTNKIESQEWAKILRKFRKAYLINEFLKNNKNIKGIIADHWKSLELIKSNKKKICLIHGKEINHDKGSLLNKRVLKVLNSTDKIIYSRGTGLSINSEFSKDEA